MMRKWLNICLELLSNKKITSTNYIMDANFVLAGPTHMHMIMVLLFLMNFVLAGPAHMHMIILLFC